MSSIGSYKARQFNLSGLKGISDQTLEMHFKHNIVVMGMAIIAVLVGVSAMPTTIENMPDSVNVKRGCYTNPDTGENVCSSKLP